MKSIKRRIIALFVCVASIIAFWLVPGINQAGDERYTRLYEDTDKREASVQQVSGPEKPKPKSKSKEVKAMSKKKYKKESIKSGAKLSDVKLSMFSRAIQFEPEIVLDSTTQQVSISADTVQQPELAKKIEMK